MQRVSEDAARKAPPLLSENPSVQPSKRLFVVYFVVDEGTPDDDDIENMAPCGLSLSKQARHAKQRL